MKEYPSKVVGINEPGRLDYILDHTQPGDELELGIEQHNAASRTVSVFHEGVKLGEIPPNRTWVWRSVMEGDEFLVILKDVVVDDDGAPSHLDIGITIIVDGEEEAPLPTSYQHVNRAAQIKRVPEPDNGEKRGRWFLLILFAALAFITYLKQGWHW